MVTTGFHCLKTEWKTFLSWKPRTMIWIRECHKSIHRQGGDVWNFNFGWNIPLSVHIYSVCYLELISIRRGLWCLSTYYYYIALIVLVVSPEPLLHRCCRTWKTQRSTAEIQKENGDHNFIFCEEWGGRTAPVPSTASLWRPARVDYQDLVWLHSSTSLRCWYSLRMCLDEVLEQ